MRLLYEVRFFANLMTNRRKFISSILGSYLATDGKLSAQTTPSNFTNFVLLLADDLGYGDLSCYGSTQIQTPNLDHMAKEGVKLENFMLFRPARLLAPHCSRGATRCARD